MQDIKSTYIQQRTLYIVAFVMWFMPSFFLHCKQGLEAGKQTDHSTALTKKLQHIIVLDACFCRNKNSKLGHRKVSNDLWLNRVSSLWVNEPTVPARNVPGWYSQKLLSSLKPAYLVWEYLLELVTDKNDKRSLMHGSGHFVTAKCTGKTML